MSRLADWLIPNSALRWRYLTGPPSVFAPRQPGELHGTPGWWYLVNTNCGPDPRFTTVSPARPR